MADQMVYLLKIMEGTRCVAEAPLIIHEKTEALRNFYEALPAVAQMALPALLSMIQIACADKEPTEVIIGIRLEGNHTGLVLGGQLPQAPSNGHDHGNRAERRHPGF